MGEKELMEDKEKEIEKLCKKAESLVIRYKRNEIPMKSFSPFQTTNYGYKSREEQQREWVRANVDEAEDLIDKALKLSEKKSAEALRIRGFINYLQCYDRYVMSNYEKAYEIDPENWKLLYNIALYYINVNEKYRDYDKANENLIKAIDIVLKNDINAHEGIWINFSELLVEKVRKGADITPKENEYQLKYLELYPKSTKALWKTANFKFVQQKFSEAIPYFETYNEKNPKELDGLRLLGDCFKELGDIENAIDITIRGLNIAKGLSTRNKWRGDIFKKNLLDLYNSKGIKLNSKEELFKYLENKKKREDKVRSLLRTGRSRNKQGDAEGAMEVLEEALELDPKCSDARIHLGVSNVILGNAEKGFQLINEIIDQHPDNSTAYISLAEAFKINGDLNKSIESYEKGITLMSPKSRNLYSHNVDLALLYSESGNTQKAIDLVNNIIKNKPNDSSLLNLCGTFYLSQNNQQKALEYFIQALKLYHHRYISYVNISLIHADFGNFDAALAYLKVGLKILPDNTQIEEALEKVYEKWGKPLDLEEFKENL